LCSLLDEGRKNNGGGEAAYQSRVLGIPTLNWDCPTGGCPFYPAHLLKPRPPVLTVEKKKECESGQAGTGDPERKSSAVAEKPKLMDLDIVLLEENQKLAPILEKLDRDNTENGTTAGNQENDDEGHIANHLRSHRKQPPKDDRLDAEKDSAKVRKAQQPNAKSKLGTPKRAVDPLPKGPGRGGFCECCLVKYSDHDKVRFCSGDVANLARKSAHPTCW
jgi:hypothetical protein